MLYEVITEHAGPLGLGRDRPHATEELEAGPDDLSEAIEDFGKVTARLLLDRNRNREEPKVSYNFV